MCVACDDDELTTIDLEVRVEGTRVEAPKLGIRHDRPEPLARQLRQAPGCHSDLWLELHHERRPGEPRLTFAAQRSSRGSQAGPAIGGRRLLLARAAHDAEPPDPRRRVDEALLGDTPRANGLDESSTDCHDRLVEEVVTEAERVRAGGDRTHGALFDSHARADRLHLERVGHDEPRESKLPAQQVVEDLAVHGRGVRRQPNGRRCAPS